MTPHLRNTFLFCSSWQLPCPILDPQRAFELTQHPSRAFDSPLALVQELQRHEVSCVTLGTEVPGARQKQLVQSLILRLFTRISGCEKPTG